MHSARRKVEDDLAINFGVNATTKKQAVINQDQREIKERKKERKEKKLRSHVASELHDPFFVEFSICIEVLLEESEVVVGSDVEESEQGEQVHHRVLEWGSGDGPSELCL